MGPPLQHVCGIAIGYCEARAVIIRRDATTNAIGQPSLVASESGARSTPCAVALGGTGECVVGDAALSQAAKNPAATVPRALSCLPRSDDDEAALKAIDKDVKAVVAKSADFAQSSPEPSPDELYTDITIAAA